MEASVGELVNIKPVPTKDDLEFVTEMARFAEGLTEEAAIRKKFRLTESDWEALGNDDDLVRAITDEKTRRIRDGSCKKEKSQLLVIRAPDVLSGILLDENANAKHRLDSAKILNDFAAPGPQGVPAADRFCITIVLNADGAKDEPATLRFNKSIRALEPNEVDPLDSSPDDLGSVPHLAAIAMKNPTENGGGQESI
jgi:hypothetical protein